MIENLPFGTMTFEHIICVVGGNSVRFNSRDMINKHYLQCNQRTTFIGNFRRKVLMFL
jgi:hypothetical protein